MQGEIDTYMEGKVKCRWRQWMEWYNRKSENVGFHKQLEEPPEGACPANICFGLVELIWYYYPPEWWENEFMWFQVTKFVAICYCNLRKLIYLPSVKIWYNKYIMSSYFTNQISESNLLLFRIFLKLFASKIEKWTRK